MALVDYQTFEYGNTIYFECTFRNLDMTKVDPVNPTYEIRNKRGVVLDSGSLTQKETGVYYVYWNADQEGKLEAVFKGTVDGNAVEMKEIFKVERISWKGESI